MKAEGWKGPEALQGTELDQEFAGIVEPMQTSLEDVEVGSWVCVERYRHSELMTRHLAVVRRKWVGDDGETKLEFTDPTPNDPRPESVTVTVVGTIR